MTKDDSFLEYYSKKIIKDLKYVVISIYSSACFHFYVRIFRSITSMEDIHDHLYRKQHSEYTVQTSVKQKLFYF